MPLKPGTILHNSYRIVRFINSGGFGCTYEAEHIELEARVAIKEFFVKDFCNRDETTGEVTVGITERTALVEKLKSKFKQEAKVIYKLSHPNIVRVTDIFEENGTAYYVMDYIDGQSLSQLVKQHGPLSESVALNYIRQVASALGYLHSQNRLHLDVKPGNIMLAPGDRAVLVDFGASKQYDSVNGENTSTLLGYTPGYAPPEQISHNVKFMSAATDIYSLGATLYNLLSGKVPTDPNMRWSMPLDPLPTGVSAATSTAVFAALNPDGSKRPQTAESFIAMIDGKTPAKPSKPVEIKIAEDTVIDDEPINTEIIPPSQETTEIDSDFKSKSERKSISTSSEDPEPEPKPKKSKLPWIIGIVCLLAVVAGVYFYLNRPIEDSYSVTNLSDGSRLYTVNGVKFTMKPVSGGTFQMGSNDGYEDNQRPVHNVTLSSYYIGETEVTQELWEAVMGDNPSRFQVSRRPVESVSYNDCIAFINRMNEITGENFRLPTEAEWEFAARGGNSSRGYKYSGSDNIDSVAWYYGNSSERTHKVKGKNPNELGLYDMSGNVLEWCSDWYDGYLSGSVTNPTGPGSGSERVIRGGSWYYHAGDCRSAYRLSDAPVNSFDIFGLRLAQ